MFNKLRTQLRHNFNFRWWHLRWQVKQIKLNQYFFLSAKTVIIAFVIFGLNLFIFRSTVNFQFKFLSLENAILTVETLTRSIVILLSIIISFTLLSFQIFNKYFGRFAFLDFFKRKHLKVIFTLFILNVVFLLYVQTYLKDCKTDERFDNYARLIFVEAIVFSVALVMSLFPVMINLLSNSQSRANLQNLFKSITKAHIYYARPFNTDSIDIEEYETNPFKIISEIGLGAIKEYDHSTFELIIRNIFSKFKNVIKQASDEELKRSLFFKFQNILADYFDLGAKEKNTSAMFQVVSCRYHLEYEIIQQESPILKDHDGTYAGWDFNFDMEKFYDKAIQHNEDSVCCRIVDYYRDYLTEIIKTKFPDKFIYDYENPYADTHFTSIIYHNFSLVTKFHSLAGQLRKTVILKNVSNLFSTLDLSILGSKNQKDTRTYLLQVNNANKLDYLKSLVEEANVKNIELSFYPFGFGSDNEIKDLKTAIVFRTSLKAFDYLFQKGAINNSIINDLKANAMGFINLYKTEPKQAKSLLTLALDKIDYTRDLIKSGDSDERKDIYLKLFRFLGYIESDYQGSNINDPDLNDKFKLIISKFGLQATFEDELMRKGYIQNKGLI